MNKCQHCNWIGGEHSPDCSPAQAPSAKGVVKLKWYELFGHCGPNNTLPMSPEKRAGYEMLQALSAPSFTEAECEALEWAARQAGYHAENRLMTDDFNGESQFKQYAATLRNLATKGRL